MIFCDTHAHLYLEEFDADRDAAIDRAVVSGVTKILLPNIDSSSVHPMLNLSSVHPSICHPMMGLHPTSVKHNWQEELDIIGEYLDAPEYCFCAVGEIGIDLYWDKTYMEQQKEAFSRQLDLAVRHNLPVAVHTRNSFDLAADIIESKENSRLRGVFHCFGGNIAQAKRAVSLGFMLGIGGVITYKNSGLQQVVATIGTEHLLLETDAPFLPPVPHRGERNESSYIPLIAAKIAEIKGVDLETIARITTENAIPLFDLSPASPLLEGEGCRGGVHKGTPMTSILVIYTGGTIGMVQDPKTGTLRPLSQEILYQFMPVLENFHCSIEFHIFDTPLDSSNMNPAFWVKLAGVIEENYEAYDGFVVLHGSDTMAYTASALSFMLENLNKPVIFTGSQLPIGLVRTDGRENFINSVEIAAAREVDTPFVPEVAICFENRLFRGNRTSKLNAEHFGAFISGNYNSLADIGVHIRYNHNLILKPNFKKLRVQKVLDDNIAILKLFPASRRTWSGRSCIPKA